MSHYTVPGKGGFFELENGKEILITPDMIPTPPKHLVADNPYSHHDKRYRQWKSCAIGRYYKTMYKELVEAKNKEDFLLKVGDARDALTDPSAWNDFMDERELDVKRPAGRPKLEESEKVNRPPKMKRSDEMKILLEENGYRVVENVVLDARSQELGKFLANGKVEVKDSSRISVHAFLNQ